MFKQFQSYIIGLYRATSISVLVIIIAGVISYLFLLAFYTVSNTWAIPLVLSPSQSKVLSFQPQIAALNLSINKQKTELINATQTKQSILEQLIQIDLLALKIEEAVKVEKDRSLQSSNSVAKIAANKRSNMAQSEKTLTVVKELERQTDTELKVGLITSDQAAQRKIALQAAINSYTDLNSSAIQNQIQSTQLRDYSNTLGGENKSLVALAPTKQLMELAALKTQLKLQLGISERNLAVVKESMAADNKIMQVAMDSPYYRALWAPTTIMFIPYDNLKNAVPKAPVYSCFLQVLLCYQVGEIEKVYDAEEYSKHPLFKSDLRGRFATVIFTDKQAAKSSVLFLGSKPLFI
jgi:hypothetical protein